MIRNLYTFGCSYTKDNYQKTWADLLAEDFNCNLHNCAERAAGADYTVKRLLVSEIEPNEYVIDLIYQAVNEPPVGYKIQVLVTNNC